MKILLDAKDLIELLERADPMPLEGFRKWLDARDAKIVLTYTNVSEFADCFRGVDDHLYIRSIVQGLESLPVTYMREAMIQVDEIELAVAAFDAGVEPTRPDPYVSRWDHTFAKRAEPPPAEMIVGYRLDMMNFDLIKKGASRRSPMTTAALNSIATDRAVPKDERPSPREGLTRTVDRYIAFWKLQKPIAGVEEFGKWLYADPRRCPGFRVAWELFQSLVANAKDTLRESDVWDNAHFPAIPYVDYVTLDKRMTGYCREISTRLRKHNSEADYSGRAFRSLRDLVTSLA